MRHILTGLYLIRFHAVRYFHLLYLTFVEIFWRYYSGYPKDLGPSRVVHFTSEREFVHLLHEGYPMVVAFTIRWFGITTFQILLPPSFIILILWYKLFLHGAEAITQNILTKYWRKQLLNFILMLNLCV